MIGDTIGCAGGVRGGCRLAFQAAAGVVGVVVIVFGAAIGRAARRVPARERIDDLTVCEPDSPEIRLAHAGDAIRNDHRPDREMF